MPPFGQTLTAMITPFDPDGAVDHQRAARLATYLIDNGSDGLVVTGTTGESPTLTTNEKLALYKTVVDAVGGRAHVLAGTGTYDTRASVEVTKRAAEMGVSGVLAVTPYYNKPDQAGLVAHFTALADATDLPLMLYNIPGRTGRRMEIETYVALAEHPNIVAVKDAVMDIDFTSATVAAVPDLAVYSGQDSYTWPMMAVGAIGVVSVISHLAGRAVSAMVDAATRGSIDEARRLHLGLLDLCEACFLEPSPSPVKAGMAMLWEPVGEPRLPLVAASEATKQAIKNALSRVQQL